MSDFARFGGMQAGAPGGYRPEFGGGGYGRGGGGGEQ